MCKHLKEALQLTNMLFFNSYAVSKCIYLQFSNPPCSPRILSKGASDFTMSDPQQTRSFAIQAVRKRNRKLTPSQTDFSKYIYQILSQFRLTHSKHKNRKLMYFNLHKTTSLRKSTTKVFNTNYVHVSILQICLTNDSLVNLMIRYLEQISLEREENKMSATRSFVCSFL